MSISKEDFNEFKETVLLMIREENKKLPYLYYLQGTVTVVNGDGTYGVKINNKAYTLKAKAGVNPALNNVVAVETINNNESYKIIDHIRV